jgi:TonB family protein
MPVRFFLFVVAISFSGSFACLSQAPAEQDQIFTKVDVPAEFPGGVTEFYKFISTSTHYPEHGIRSGIEGETLIEFVVSASGYIETNTVKVYRSLHHAFDEEAMRIITSCRTRWNPAQKDGKTVRQKLTFPVGFKLKQFPLEEVSPANRLSEPIRTVVVKKEFSRSFDDDHWAIFSDKDLIHPLGRVSIGDSINVAGWAAWAYYIKNKAQYGYVSWKSVAVTDKLDSLAEIVALRSEEEEESQTKLADRVYRMKEPIAHLSLTADKSSIFQGECVTVTLAFNVNENNEVPLRFYNLGNQLQQILTNHLTTDKCWITNGRIENVEGMIANLKGGRYTSYPFYKASYCPITGGTINLPSIKLEIARHNRQREFDTIQSFYSDPLSIQVKALPANVKPSSYDYYKMTGKFELIEDIQQEAVAGKVIRYSFVIAGRGLTFPVEPPIIQMENVVAQFQDLNHEDTLINNELQSRKTFVYDLIFKSPGNYDLSKAVTFDYFDPESGKIVSLKSNKVIAVSNSSNKAEHQLNKMFYSKNNLIAFDASTSMQVEDYFPYRLKAVTNGLDAFFAKREICDVGLIIFAGDAKLLSSAQHDSCYSKSSLSSISKHFNKNGTAIGDAIWLAKISFAQTTAPKKLVIIGDGDNTAGHLSLKAAAELAKKYNIRIYTIGIGTKGPAPFGKDESGNPYMIENTFTDKDFKMLSTLTGGQYYWAKDEKEVIRILEVIFN